MLTAKDLRLCFEWAMTFNKFARGTLMTRNLRLLILPALLIAFGCSSVSAGSPGDCVAYEPNGVQLTGRIVTKVFPGPPNYESVKEGDEPLVLPVSRKNIPDPDRSKRLGAERNSERRR